MPIESNESLELETEVAEEAAGPHEPEIKDESDDLSLAAKLVLDVIVKNVADTDLQQSMVVAVQGHFDYLREHPTQGPDTYNIPVLNQKIWDAFHEYETFIHQNHFENIDLNELGNIIRTYVTPKITDILWERDLAKSRQS